VAVFGTVAWWMIGQLRVEMSWNGPHFTKDSANLILNKLMMIVELLSDPTHFSQNLDVVLSAFRD
jgi:hypothetical protein